MICTVPTCTRPVMARGYCSAHYQRVKYGAGLRAETPIRERVDSPDLPALTIPQRVAVLDGALNARLDAVPLTGDWRADCAALDAVANQGLDLACR